MGDTGGMKCHPSVLGNLDLYGDVIFPGAFRKCLPMFLKRGFVPMDHEWHWSALVGFPTVAEERGNALYSEFTFHSDQQSQDARAKCAERMAAGLEVGLSIGFSMMPGQYIYFASGKELLAYAKGKSYDLSLFDVKAISAYTSQCTAIVEIEELWEYSLTPAPANQQAMAIAVKSHSQQAPRSQRISLSANKKSTTTTDALSLPNAPSRVTRGQKSMLLKTKTICGAFGLPLADEDQKWSAKDAEARLRELTGAEEEPNAEYAKAFVAVDGPNDEFTSYKLLIADVVDGQIKAVPKAILTAAGVLDGTRGGSELDGAALASAKSFLGSYYLQMGKSAPWAKDSDGEEYRWKGQYLGAYVEYSMAMAAMTQAHYALQYEVADALEGYGEYDEMDDDEVLSAIGNCFDEHKALCMSVFQAIRSGCGEETPTQAALSVRSATLSQLSSLGDGLTYAKYSRVAVDAARELIDRTKSRIDMRLKEGRTLSESNRQMLTDHRDTLSECVTTIDSLLTQTESKADLRKARDLRIQHLLSQAEQ